MPRGVVMILVAALGWAAGLPLDAQVRRGQGAGLDRKLGNPRVRQQLKRLEEMKPAERRRMLERLPPERRKMAEERLKRWEKLTPEQRQKLAGDLENLSPERRARLRELWGSFNEISDERKLVLRRELNELRWLTADERKARMSSDEFRNRFSSKEQQLLTELSETLAPSQEQ